MLLVHGAPPSMLLRRPFCESRSGRSRGDGPRAAEANCGPISMSVIDSNGFIAAGPCLNSPHHQRSFSHQHCHHHHHHHNNNNNNNPNYHHQFTHHNHHLPSQQSHQYFQFPGQQHVYSGAHRQSNSQTSCCMHVGQSRKTLSPSSGYRGGQLSGYQKRQLRLPVFYQPASRAPSSLPLFPSLFLPLPPAPASPPPPSPPPPPSVSPSGVTARRVQTAYLRPPFQPRCPSAGATVHRFPSPSLPRGGVDAALSSGGLACKPCLSQGNLTCLTPSPGVTGPSTPRPVNRLDRSMGQLSLSFVSTASQPLLMLTKPADPPRGFSILAGGRGSQGSLLGHQQHQQHQPTQQLQQKHQQHQKHHHQQQQQQHLQLFHSPAEWAPMTVSPQDSLSSVGPDLMAYWPNESLGHYVDPIQAPYFRASQQHVQYHNSQLQPMRYCNNPPQAQIHTQLQTPDHQQTHHYADSQTIGKLHQLTHHQSKPIGRLQQQPTDHFNQLCHAQCRPIQPLSELAEMAGMNGEAVLSTLRRTVERTQSAPNQSSLMLVGQVRRALCSSPLLSKLACVCTFGLCRLAPS
ncbi:unnamed protein product [Protopolystoma xenopodis]|uniref:Uncharacterized protein n=1 Tax=Protopolystoma xenopodis TaxID=117903 RepID=A0A3S4ZSQ0_9PLAT|nr:unnamed protein product [Protopolystoma xenopodis]